MHEIALKSIGAGRHMDGMFQKKFTKSIDDREQYLNNSASCFGVFRISGRVAGRMFLTTRP
jgi:hypothetical protein